MRILVCPHELAMGGSQINAIELAAAVRDRGHEVTIFAPDGILAQMIQDLHLDYIQTPVTSTYPSIRSSLNLLQIVQSRRIDLVHTYEWRPTLEATFGAHLLRRTPMLMTILSMSVPRFLPRHLPIVVGTRQLAEQRPTGQDVHVLEPPIDTLKNQASDVPKARDRWGFQPNDVIVSVICRLTTDLEKLDGVLTGIDVVGNLARKHPVKFLIVGGGEGLQEVEKRADAVNRHLGRTVVIVAGPMIDPQDAYGAADIVLGMGSSALKGMSFSKPLVVQGEAGFWRLLNRDTASLFLNQGWFGHGGEGAADLQLSLEALIENPSMRQELGDFGRRLVVEKFSLDHAADELMRIYDQVAVRCAPLEFRIPSIIRSAAGFSKFGAAMAHRAFMQRLGMHRTIG